jgi:hypothetical protein
MYDDFPLLMAAKEAWRELGISAFLRRECRFCFSLSQTNSAMPFIEHQAAVHRSSRTRHGFSEFCCILFPASDCQMTLDAPPKSPSGPTQRSPGITLVELALMDN